MRYLLSTLTTLLAAFALSACMKASAGETQKHPLAGKAIALPEPLPEGNVDLPRFPAIRPDGSAITFSWRGDLWRVGSSGGHAVRLSSHPMNETYSAWSPDGKRVAFNSDRTGYTNIYVMGADGQAVAPVTREDRSHVLAGWADEQTLTVSAFREADVHRNARPYSVSAAGGPITRLHDAFGRSPVVSPDGRYVAFVRGRARWNKPFMTNSDNRDLWLFNLEEKSFRRLTENPGNDGMPRWVDNQTIAYLSARPPRRINLYQMDVEQGEASSVALTAFTEDDVQHFDVAREGGLAVLHVWDRLFTLDLTDAKAEPSPLSITAPTDAKETTVVQSLKNKANDAALSPDGRVMAVSVRGELFVKTLDSKNPPQRVTKHISLDDQPAWSADGQSLYFTSDRDGTLSIYQARVTMTRGEIEGTLAGQAIEPALGEDESQVEQAETALEDEPDQAEAAEDSGQEAVPNPAERWHDAVRFEIKPVVQTEFHDADPSPSPDGKLLAFRRGNGKLVLLDLESAEERTYLDQWDMGLHWAWSGDGRYLAASYEDQDHNADIWVGPIDGSTPPINISKHPAQDVLPSFSLDSKILTFVSGRHDRQYDVYAVYLDKAFEAYTPEQMRAYYGQAEDLAKKHKPLSAVPVPADKDSEEAEAESDEAVAESDGPVPPLDLDDAYLRLRRLTDTPESEWDVVVHPNGGRVVFSRDETVYAIGWDGKDEKKLADGFEIHHLSLDGSKVVGLQNQNAAAVPTSGGDGDTAEITGSIRVDRQAMQGQRFLEASRALTMSFYDGSFKGIDWRGVTDKYAQLAARTQTPDEFDDVANRYLGLLNASHMGIRSPEMGVENSQPNGRLGAIYKRVDTGFEVIAIEPNSPADRGQMRLRVGDIITDIDGEPFVEADTVAARLAGRVGNETLVSVRRMEEATEELKTVYLLMTPISYRAFNDLRYDNWRRANAARVAQLSEDRLGYIHIESMNESSLAEYERDLYAACEGKDGLVIDVRDNGGGWTTDRLLASIMAERHAYTVPRGADPGRTNSYPIPRLYIQRYNLPMNALCNEHSFSNAEIFSHAFKTLERGTLVGNTTAGGVISTGGTRLLDGTTVRMPFRGWFLPDGTDMENNGAVPDLLIPQTPEDEAAGRDAQLEAAVKDLLDRLE